MVHDNVVSNWVYEHYLIYLSLSIADSDCLISKKEMDRIGCETFPSLPTDRCSSLIKEVYQEFWSHDEEERINYIRSFAPQFLRTDSVRLAVIHHLERMIKDKDEESEEYIMFRYIRKIISNCK